MSIKYGAPSTFQDLINLLKNKLTQQENVAEEFDSTKAYSSGDVVWHENALYEFDSNHAAGSWDPSEVTEKTITDLIGEGGGGSSVSPYTSNPAMDGTASAGSSNDYSRGDHVHPSDTNKVNKSGDTMTGALTVQGAITSTSEITDGGGNVLSDKFDATSYVDRYERYTITASSWSASPDANGYYTYSLTTSAYNTYKGVEMQNVGSADGVRATNAEKAAFNLVSDFYMANGTGVTDATLYAKTKPTTTFYIMLKGNYAARNAASSTKALDITTGCEITLSDGTSEYAFDGSTERTYERKSSLVTIPSTGWSSVVDANGYYTNTVTIPVINTRIQPKVSPIGSTINTRPTSSEGAAYNLVDDFICADGTSITSMTAYAKTKPTTTFYVLVTGDYFA